MGNALAFLGVLLVLAGGIWIAVMAFQKGNIVMGIVCLLCPSCVALIYGLMNFNEMKAPVVMIIVGVILNGAGALTGAPLFELAR